MFGDSMNKENLMDKLVEAINKIESKKCVSYDEKVDFWKKQFDNKSALKWNDSIIDLENQYLKSSLARRKLLNCYDIVSLASVAEEYKDKVIIWDDDVTTMVVDALVIPASYDICDNKERKLHDIYYCNGIRLRKKIITIMDGEKLKKNEVLITRSYNVLADYIMHVYYDKIRDSIINVMECARVNMVKTLVICLGGDIKDVKVVYSTVLEYLSKYDMMFDKVILSIEKKDIRDNFIEELNKEA